MDEEIRKNKRGQIAIWVIVALALVVVIILFFLLRESVIPDIGGGVSDDPRGFIDSCVKKHVNDVVDIMLPKGGFIEPEHAKMYNNINISYLCYNRGNYLPCVNEHPLFLNEMTAEIKDYITPKVDECFNDYKSEMEKRNVGIDLDDDMNLKVSLGRDRIFVEIEREIIINENQDTKEIDDFDIEIISPLYDIGRVAMEIASQEAKYCYFEYVGYMILYPEFKIKLDQRADYSKIYTIEDKESGKVMNIAIRSCAIPPGL